MGLEILVTDEDKEKIEDEYSEKVKNQFMKKVSRKEDELEWVSSIQKGLKRFYNPIGENGFYLAEMKVDCQNKSYRGLFIPIKDSFVLWDFVEKQNNYKHSEQRQVLDVFHKEPEKVKEAMKDKYMMIKDL